MALQALVFDFDGLILDTEWPEFVSVQAEFEAHGVEMTLEWWQQFVGRADHPHWSILLEERLDDPSSFDRDLVIERRRQNHHSLIHAQEILPGVRDLITEAQARGLGLAVASSSPSGWVDGHLERLGLRRHFSAVWCCDHVERAKPAPELYERAVASLGVDPTEAVAFEDSHHGSVAAKTAGLYTVVVPNDVTSSQSFEFADEVHPSLTQVDLRRLL